MRDLADHYELPGKKKDEAVERLEQAIRNSGVEVGGWGGGSLCAYHNEQMSKDDLFAIPRLRLNARPGDGQQGRNLAPLLAQQRIGLKFDLPRALAANARLGGGGGGRTLAVVRASGAC
ncbi:MAG: hypothetical protein ACRELS_20300 [Candidatus Rokuibacteriota bacterium]